jgi:hypothetical protein
MARKPSLADALVPPRGPAAPPQAPVATAPGPAPRTASRQGKKGIAFWLDPAAWRQLQQLALNESTPEAKQTIQGLMEEAVDLLFRNRGLHRLAGEGRE